MEKILIIQNSNANEEDLLVINGKVTLYNHSTQLEEIVNKMNQTSKMFDYSKYISKIVHNTSYYLSIYLRGNNGLVLQSNFLDLDERGRRIAYSFYHSLKILIYNQCLKNIFKRNYYQTLITECEFVVDDFIEYCKIAKKSPKKEDIIALRYSLLIFSFHKSILTILLAIIIFIVFLLVVL